MTQESVFGETARRQRSVNKSRRTTMDTRRQNDTRRNDNRHTENDDSGTKEMIQQGYSGEIRRQRHKGDDTTNVEISH
jgi:hypothetical protein